MNRRQRKVFTVVAVVLAAAVAGVLALPLLDARKPDPEKASPHDFGRYISSRNFRRMPPDERRTFMKRMRDRGIRPEDAAASLSPEQRDNFRRNMELFRQERLKKCYRAAPEQQERMLQEAARDMRSGRGGRDMKPPDGTTPSHKKSLEGQSPEDRARSIEFDRRLKNHLKNK